MMDPLEKAKSEMGGIERVLSSLPGIRGYREKEMRRDADKQVREALASELKTRRNRISNLQQDLLTGGGLLWMDDVERVVGRLQLLIDRVKTAAYGYAGWFDIERVKEDDLDRLMAFDQALFEELGRLDVAIDEVEKSIQNNDGIQAALKAIADMLAGLNERFTRRMDVLKQSE